MEKAEIVEMAIKHIQSLENYNSEQNLTKKMIRKEREHHYNLGYKKCISETIRFVIEVENKLASDGFFQRLIEHLKSHSDKISEIESIDTFCSNNHSSCDQSLSIDQNQSVSKNEYTEDESNILQEKNTSKIMFNQCPSSSSSSFSKVKLYKFKKNIKERFQADIDSVKDSGSLSSGNEDQQIQESESKQSESESNNSGHSFDSSGGSLSSLNSSNIIFNSEQKNLTIPGFALHPSRSFYVPILIRSPLEFIFDISQSTLQLLHPVNISVNFYHKNSSISGNNVSCSPSSENIIVNNGESKKVN